jgi:hypothetical protein
MYRTQEHTVKQALVDGISTTILTFGIGWGVVTFFQGLAASFTVNSIRLVESIIAVIFGFLIILPIAIIAVWWPKASTVLLALSFILVEISGFADDGVRGIFLVAKKVALPDLLLMLAYAYLAFLKRKLQL